LSQVFLKKYIPRIGAKRKKNKFLGSFIESSKLFRNLTGKAHKIIQNWSQKLHRDFLFYLWVWSEKHSKKNSEPMLSN